MFNHYKPAQLYKIMLEELPEYRDGYAAGWFTRYEIIESPLYAENIEEKGGAADDAAKTDLL